MREKPLILIIDDEPEIREIVKTKLEASGFETKEASQGAEGIKLAQEFKPDIILLDVVMPEMDGVEALLKLKAIRTPKISRSLCLPAKAIPGRKLLKLIVNSR